MDNIMDNIDTEDKIDNSSLEWGIMITIQNNLNDRIGKLKWKKYITASFWNYISTPINFTITLFTALSAGQTTSTQSFLTNNQLFYLLFISFVLSIINTFFKLKDKAILNYDAYKRYDKFGTEYEEIYFTPILNNNDINKRLGDYNLLQQKLNDYYSEENIENVNYTSEVIYEFAKIILRINMEQIKINKRIWILDGEKKNNLYKKNNIEFDTEKLFVFNNYFEPKKLLQNIHNNDSNDSNEHKIEDIYNKKNNDIANYDELKQNDNIV
jgi:hypothetical protein